MPEKVVEKIYKKVADSQQQQQQRQSVQVEDEITSKAKFIASERPDFEAILAPVTKKKENIKKTLRPPSEYLAKLGLKPGCNTLKYVVHTSLQGE